MPLLTWWSVLKSEDKLDQSILGFPSELIHAFNLLVKLANLAFLSFKVIIIFFYQADINFVFKLVRLLRLISYAHYRASELLFSLAQEQNLLALGNQTWIFLLPCLGKNYTFKHILAMFSCHLCTVKSLCCFVITKCLYKYLQIYERP